MYVQWRVQHIKRGSPRCAKPVSSAPLFSEPVSSAPQRSLPTKSNFQNTQGTLFTIYLLPRDPSNFPRITDKSGGSSPPVAHATVYVKR